jgi:DNA-binding NarL/FixJ family response regulator
MKNELDRVDLIILKYIANGFSVREIAEARRWNNRTIESRLSRMRKSYSATTCAELVFLASKEHDLELNGIRYIVNSAQSPPKQI